MKNNLLKFMLLFLSVATFAQNKVFVEKDNKGTKLTVDGKPFIVNGINWDYVPIGYNVLDAKFWQKPDDVIKAGLDEEMPLWQNMGVNAIRTYIGMPPKWITYIYENFGIYTMINHQFGAYGLTLDGVWYPKTKYANEKVRKHLIDESVKMAKMYKNTPGLLLYMLGNENNYHLTWDGAETDEGIVINDKDEAKRAEARAMYKLFNDATLAMKKVDKNHPIGMCNGDLLYLDIVASECKDIDIYGTNMYRGISFVDAFDRVKKEFGKPILFTEFGSDAYNARDGKEDQLMQAYYMVGNWKEIYENSYGQGKAENSLGGFTFQSSDGWFKSGFDERKNADIHDTQANWPSNGYSRDQAKENDPNMNEEWFGIAAKGPTDIRGLYKLYPRASYYALKKAHTFNPFNGVQSVESHFNNINLMDAVLKARGDKAALNSESGGRLKISQLRAEFTTFYTGGDLITTPETPDPNGGTYPNQLGFDHMQSYFIGVEGRPSDNMRAEVNFNVIGKVAENPIDEIFYENRARPIRVETSDGEAVLTDNNRVNVYNAEFEWNAKEFDLRGFYRTGHYHWGYEGDFFGLYPEANYGPNLDIYGGEILGAEIDAKGALKGLKAAVGPQLWWGANPTALIKYQRKFGQWDVAGIYHRDFETELKLDETGNRILNQNQVRSGVIPGFPTERASLAVERDFGKFGLTLGGLWGGSPLNGTTFEVLQGDVPIGHVLGDGTPVTEAGAKFVYQDKINSDDNWGAKAKLTYKGGKFNWYAQGSIMGLVANGGADQTQTFTGWKLRDSGSSNMNNFLSGFTYTIGNFQIAPNFLWQKPLVDPMQAGVTVVREVNGLETLSGSRLRNVIDDPFVVRGGNRETTAGEILLTYDPTPGTWMYAWDNDRAEDAEFAFNLGFVYRHLPTTQDGHIAFGPDRQIFRLGSAPAQDLWEVHSRIVSKQSVDKGFVANIYAGNGQANGGDIGNEDLNRTISRFGTDVRYINNKFKAMGAVKVNDWGPFDYHRDYNLTYPLQLMLDLSTAVSKQDWFILPSTRLGARFTWRSLDKFSNRFPEELKNVNNVGNGNEWEIRTYIHINIGK